MKRVTLVILMLLTLVGCTSNGEPSNTPVEPPVEVKEDLFKIYKQDNYEVPILEEPLAGGDGIYWVRDDKKTGYIYEAIPTSYIIECNTRSNLYMEGPNEAPKIEPLILYMTVTADGNERNLLYTGYLKNSGSLFVEGKGISLEDYSREQQFDFFNIVRNEAFTSRNWAYSSPEGEQEEFMEIYLFDTADKGLILNEVTSDTTERYSQDNNLGIPEYKNEIKKDKQELASDVNKKVLLATKEERHDDEKPLVSRVFEDELDRLFDIGYIQGPYKIYVEPEIAKIREYTAEIKVNDDGLEYERKLTDEKGTYYFDTNWRLAEYVNEDIKAEYTYTDKTVNIKLTDLKSQEEIEIEYKNE